MMTGGERLKVQDLQSLKSFNNQNTAAISGRLSIIEQI